MRRQRSRDKLERVEGLRAEARAGGGEDAIEAQHQKGKLTARERLDLLFDQGTFQELDLFVRTGSLHFGEKRSYLTDGVVTGYGSVRGRPLYVFAQDFTIMGGSLGERHAQKIVKLMQMAVRNGIPIVGLNDSGGARIQEGVQSLAAYADIFYHNSVASGVVPQVAAIMGPCAGGAVYSPALMDFVFMVKGTSYMFLTGPQVIKAVLHQDVTAEEVGGARVHNQISGVAHFMAADDEDALEGIKKLLSYLPSNNLEDPPFVPTDDPADRREDRLDDILPDDPNKPYDVQDVIQLVVDKGDFYEIHAHYAANAVVGFARMNGYPVGIVANQPRVLAGVLDTDASRKISRFIRFCDAFNLPLVTLEDVPGFLPGIEQEHGGIIREGAKIVYAYSEATVPKITVVLRKAFGGAYCVMGSKHLSGDINLAWPTAELAVMGAEGAVNILYRRELAKSEDADALRQEFIESYENQVMNPFIAAERGYIDDIIEPRDTRVKIINALEMTRSKREQRPPRKHGTGPL
jgi:propionyl-CoA carboxylase beta chain